MKKKVLTLIFILVLSLTFAACTPVININVGKDNEQSDTLQNSQEESSTVTDSKPEEQANSKQEAKPSEETSKPTGTTSKPKVESSKEQTSSKETSSKETSSKVTSSKQTSSKDISSKETSSKETISQQTSNEELISRAKAKSIALKDAGLKDSQIYDYEIELDRERGITKYEISFENNGKDYDYEIDAKTGKIISVDKPNLTSNEVTVTKADAQKIALENAGVKSEDIRRYEVELEKDDGIYKYEISFYSGNIEYEYVINAHTGKIIKSEKDIDD